jgi:alanyl-tRNA synthetase
MLRLIEVEGFDLSACGGTHVSRSGAVGGIAGGSWERFKGGQRLEFYCGARAMRRLQRLRDIVGRSVRLLSVLPEGLPGAIERLQNDARAQQRAMTLLQRDLVRYQADELAAAADSVAAGKLVLRTLDASPSDLKAIAASIASKPGHIAVLGSASAPATIVVARSEGVPIAANDIIAAVIGKVGGRGGGRAELAQAGGLDADPQTVLSTAREAIVRSA